MQLSKWYCSSIHRDHQLIFILTSINHFFVCKYPKLPAVFFIWFSSLTTALTSYYSTLKRDSPLRIFVAAYFSLHNLSQLFTVLFCLIRLLVFINKEERLETYRCVFWIWSITSVIFCAVIYIIHFLYGIVCLPMYFPFQYGAILVTSNLYYETILYSAVEVIFKAVFCICVVVSTFLKLVKLKSMKQLSSISSKNTKAERTLTITMLIIVFPTVFDEFISVNSSSSK
ncbi:hypothetical protein CRE_02660 [Caenorhabditis remanei]|uniref:Serpentine receptor class gamma n=1 Tax=Caenorhabditis remanei TaxID=31234 RepID=E3NG28_CAERE|nr:hypothetical protein CRE_02660 [Caenorhabditis remanei]